MYKVYFKQAVQMLKQNRFISVISILGTALAIMMIMTIIVADEVQNINVAPEDKRDRTFYVSFMSQMDTVKTSGFGGMIRKEIAVNYLAKMKTPEVISVYDGIPSWDQPTETIVGRDGQKESFTATLRMIDDGFWKIFNFDFLQGVPFSREEFESGMPVAVISESTARKFFRRDESPVGKTIRIDFNAYRVTGVVKDVSPVFKKAKGDIWIPYTYKAPRHFEVAMLARDMMDYPDIYAEVREIERQFGLVTPNTELIIRGPENHKHNTLDIEMSIVDQMQNAIKVYNRKMAFILIVLLLVPAVNLSSFSLSRMKKRMAEIGIRKAFGAKKQTILMQVIYENMITSLIGGIIGLVFSFWIVYLLRHWLLQVPAESWIPVGTLVSIPVFLAVFIACLLLNLLSAGIPAWRASRMNIVDSLTQNDK